MASAPHHPDLFSFLLCFFFLLLLVHFLTHAFAGVHTCWGCLFLLFSFLLSLFEVFMPMRLFLIISRLFLSFYLCRYVFRDHRIRAVILTYCKSVFGENCIFTFFWVLPDQVGQNLLGRLLGLTSTRIKFRGFFFGALFASLVARFDCVDLSQYCSVC